MKTNFIFKTKKVIKFLWVANWNINRKGEDSSALDRFTSDATYPHLRTVSSWEVLSFFGLPNLSLCKLSKQNYKNVKHTKINTCDSWTSENKTISTLPQILVWNSVTPWSYSKFRFFKIVYLQVQVFRGLNYWEHGH